MNKEEMLTTLESIQKKMAAANISEYNLEKRVNKLEEFFAERETCQTELKYLKEKLSNDDNYIDRTPAMYDESRRFNLEDYLETCENIEQENLNNIARYESLIEQLENNIDTQEIESKKVVETLNAEIAEQGADLRDSLDMDEQAFQDLRESIANNMMLRDAYRENITESRAALERYKERLKSYEEQAVKLKADTQKAEADIAHLDEEVANRGKIDSVKKKKDEMKAAALEKRLEVLNVQENFVSYDHEKEMASIIKDYKAGNISDEEVIERVKEVRSYVVKKFLEDDIDKRYTDTVQNELENNKKAQTECLSDIVRLEKKLANEDNYLVSAVVVERNNRQLKKMGEKISKADDRINNYTAEIASLQQDIELADTMIKEAEQEKRNIQMQIRRFGVNITPEVEKDLLEQIASRNEDIAYLQSAKLEASMDLEHNKEELTYLKSKQERYVDLQSRLTASLEKRNGIDVSTKRLDEMQLYRLKSDLEALKRDENFIGISLAEEFDNIINGKPLAKDSQVVTGEETQELTEEETKELEDFLDSLENVDINKPLTDNSQKDEASKEEELTDEELTEQFMDKFLDEETNENQQDGPTKEETSKEKTGKMKFKDQGENEKLSKKAKNKGFIAKLKKWWKVVAAVVAIAAIAVGLKSCSLSDINNKVLDAQENPSRYEDMTDTEIKDTIEEELNLNVENPVLQPEETKESEIAQNKLKSNEEIAKEVIKGLWGNGKDRIDRLTEAGYDAEAIQDIVNSLMPKPNKVDNNTQTVQPQNTVQTPGTGQAETIIDNGPLSIEEQNKVLIDQGIIPSEDAPVITVVDEIPKIDDEPGEFIEDEIPENKPDNDSNDKPSGENSDNDSKPDNNDIDDDWGPFIEEGTTPSGDQPSDDVTPENENENEPVNPDTPSGDQPSEDIIPDQPSNSDTVEVSVNTGEKYTLETGGTTYELNNSDMEATEGAASFIESADTKNLTEDENGTVNLEISADAIKRDQPLTLEEIQKIRDELAAQLGQDSLTQDQVEQINAEYQEGGKAK